MRQNGKKTPPHSDTPFPCELVDTHGNPLPRDQIADNYARRIVRGWKELSKSLEDDRRRLRRKDNRQEDAKALRKAKRILRRYAGFLRDHPQAPTIYVKEFRPGGMREAQLKATDYISQDQLSWIADCLQAQESPAGMVPKLIKALAAEIADYYRETLGKPRWEKVGEIILEEFPDGQETKGKTTAGDVAAWARQLVSRKTL